jgi:NADH-quinone oxidoreductase subunit J
VETVIQIIFVVVAVLIVGAGVMVVTVRNIIHSALWLITSFFGVGMLYLLLEAEFLAVSQVLIYVGAVSVLVLFAIMLTRSIAEERVHKLYDRWWVALIIAGTLFAAILVPTYANYQWNVLDPVTAETIQISSAADLGVAFMQEYLLPFEVAAVLLLVALVGAIVIAYEERAQRRKIPTLAEQWATRQQAQEQSGSGDDSSVEEPGEV